MAVDVNAVLHPPITGHGAQLRVLLDGEPIDAEAAVRTWSMAWSRSSSRACTGW